MTRSLQLRLFVKAHWLLPKAVRARYGTKFKPIRRSAILDKIAVRCTQTRDSDSRLSAVGRDPIDRIRILLQALGERDPGPS